MNNDALKNNKAEHLSETWTNLVQDLKLFEEYEDHTIFLRNRWVLGSAEWMAGENGSKQNDKELFDYSDDEWQYIWSTMAEDKAWAVPSIKDSSGIVLKANFAPEIMIKYIAHDLKCHIIVIDLLLDSVQFCSGNHVKDDNVVFDSPLILYSTGGHFQSVFQIDHEFFISYARNLEDLNKGPSTSSETDGLSTKSSELGENDDLPKAQDTNKQMYQNIHPTAKSMCESPAPQDPKSPDANEWVFVKQKKHKTKIQDLRETQQIFGMSKSDKTNFQSSEVRNNPEKNPELNKYVCKKKLKDMSVEERREYHRQKYNERMSKMKEPNKMCLKKTWASNQESQRSKKKIENPEKFKESMAAEKSTQRSEKREENPEKFKETHAANISYQRSKKREKNPEKFKESIATEKSTQRIKKREENPEMFKKSIATEKSTHHTEKRERKKSRKS